MQRPQTMSDANQVSPFSKRKMNNQDLIDGIVTGSPVAARQFHQRYSAEISQCVWYLIGKDSEHEDIVQQILANILSNLKTIKKPSSLDSWVKSVVIRTVREELRKRKTKHNYFSKSIDVDYNLFPEPSSPWKYAHIRSFYRILDKLPPDDRIIFILRHLEGMAIEEIAEFGGYSESTAKRRLKRAKSLFLKEAMTDLSLLSLIMEGHEF